MKAIDNLLSSANTALSTCTLVNTTTFRMLKGEYDGYLAGFGPAVITSGLIQTLATYEADDERKKVLRAIAIVANIDNKLTGKDLLEHCLRNHADKQKLNIWRTKIINASIALKMMIRTYQQP